MIQPRLSICAGIRLSHGLLAFTIAASLSQGQEAPVTTPAGTSVLTDALRPAIPTEEYRQRREVLTEKIREALAKEAEQGGRRATGQPIVVLRGTDNPDIEGRFRQSNDFAYLTGANIPGAVLVLFPADSRERLYLPPANPRGGYFTEALPGPGPETAAALGIDEVVDTGQLIADLFAALTDPGSSSGRSRPVVYVRQTDPGNLPQGAENRLIRLLRDGSPRADFRDVSPLIAAMRKVKSPAEQALLQRAIDITGRALDQAARVLAPGVPEYRLQGEIIGTFVREGAAREGFPSIVGSGPNSTVPHYFSDSRVVEPGDLVVLDIGAEYLLYTADITRTLPADGHFTARQREIYQLVLDAQRAVEAQMKPGETRLSDMTRFTNEFFRQSPLRALDMDGKERTMDAFFVHGLGHYLGMDVHDVGSYGEPIQVGEVFTIEPGLYIKSENIGVRIEDDYVMTEEGPRKLSAAIPCEPDAIEAWMSTQRATR